MGEQQDRPDRAVEVAEEVHHLTALAVGEERQKKEAEEAVGHQMMVTVAEEAVPM